MLNRHGRAIERRGPDHRLLVGDRTRDGPRTWRRRGIASTRPPASPEAIEDLKADGCETLACDVTDEESMKACVDAVEQAEGAVGALVNNAGYSQSGAIETVPLESVRRQFETNVFGLVRMCQLVLPGHAAPGPRADRQPQLDRRQADLPRRRHLPRRPSTRSRRSPTCCASRSPASAIQVVVIEPGLITTELRRRGGRIDGRDVSHDGPYGEFNTAVGRETAGAYEGGLARLGGGPETVARKIERAITARRPKTALHGDAVGEDRPRRCGADDRPACGTGSSATQFPRPG